MRIEELTLKGKTLVPLKIHVQAINKGTISIKFANEIELQEIIEKIGH